MAFASKYICLFFDSYLLEQRNLANNTRNTYRDGLKQWILYVCESNSIAPEQLTIGKLDYNSVVGFLSHLEKQGKIGISTRNLRLSTIKTFAKYVSFLEITYLENYRLIKLIPTKKSKKPIVPYLNQEQFDELASGPDQTTWIGFRDYVILLFLFRTGLRVSELTALKLENLILGETAKVHVMGKGRKERSVFLMRDIEKAIRNLIRKRKPNSDQALFTTYRGHRMSVDNVQRIVRNYSAELNLKLVSKRKVSPHVLRHSAAMSLQKSGVDISFISRMFGHSHLDTTLKYLHEDMDRMKAELGKLQVLDPNFREFEPSDKLIDFLDNIGVNKKPKFYG